MSASALIKRFGQKVTVLRDTNPETRTKGKRDPDVYTAFVITASVQPFDPDETIEEGPGGERNRHGIRLYTTNELKSVDVENKLKADMVQYLGDTFEVTRVSKWLNNKRHLTHYKAIAFKVNSKGVK